MGPILPSDFALVDKLEECLVNKSRNLKRMIGALPAKISGSETPQLGVHERRQFLECLLVSVAPVYEEPGNVMG
jgi:hypothetical protein